MAHKRVEKVIILLKVAVFIVLLVLLAKFYLIDLINQHASKLTNTAIYEEKVALGTIHKPRGQK